MSDPFDPCVLTVTFSSQTLWDDGKRLTKVLIAGGENPTTLCLDTLIHLAVRQRTVDLINRAENMGLEFHLPKVVKGDKGDTHALFGFDNKTDAAAFKIALL